MNSSDAEQNLIPVFIFAALFVVGALILVQCQTDCGTRGGVLVTGIGGWPECVAPTPRERTPFRQE